MIFYASVYVDCGWNIGHSVKASNGNAIVELYAIPMEGKLMKLKVLRAFPVTTYGCQARVLNQIKSNLFLHRISLKIESGVFTIKNVMWI